MNKIDFKIRQMTIDDYEEVYDEENNDELNINVDDLNDDYLENK